MFTRVIIPLTAALPSQCHLHLGRSVTFQSETPRGHIAGLNQPSNVIGCNVYAGKNRVSKRSLKTTSISSTASSRLVRLNFQFPINMSATSIKVTVRDDNYTSAEAKSPTCSPNPSTTCRRQIRQNFLRP